jgi:hypothetical protein
MKEGITTLKRSADREIMIKRDPQAFTFIS